MKIPKVVLLVDDQSTALVTFSRILKKLGVESIVTASDGEAALKLYKQSAFDLVLLDIQMPRMDGIKVLKEIRNLNPEATILMISSISDKNQVERCIQLGAFDYILKTDDIGVVIDKISNVFQKKRVYWQFSRNHIERISAKLEEPATETFENLEVIAFETEFDPDNEVDRLSESNDIPIDLEVAQMKPPPPPPPSKPKPPAPQKAPSWREHIQETVKE